MAPALNLETFYLRSCLEVEGKYIQHVIWKFNTHFPFSRLCHPVSAWRVILMNKEGSWPLKHRHHSDWILVAPSRADKKTAGTWRRGQKTWDWGRIGDGETSAPLQTRWHFSGALKPGKAFDSWWREGAFQLKIPARTKPHHQKNARHILEKANPN